MAAVLDYLVTLGPWNWVILAAFLFILETIIPGVHFVWFGTAAMTIGAVLLAGSGLAPEATAAIGWQVQVIAFALLSVATIFFFRQFAGDGAQPSDAPHLNVRASQYIGRIVTVAEPITGGRGKVRVGDTLWVAEGVDAEAGARVRVTGVDGTVLKVEAA